MNRFNNECIYQESNTFAEQKKGKYSVTAVSSISWNVTGGKTLIFCSLSRLDLKEFLTHKPLRARQPPVLSRLRICALVGRWLRKHVQVRDGLRGSSGDLWRGDPEARWKRAIKHAALHACDPSTLGVDCVRGHSGMPTLLENGRTRTNAAWVAQCAKCPRHKQKLGRTAAAGVAARDPPHVKCSSISHAEWLELAKWHGAPSANKRHPQ